MKRISFLILIFLYTTTLIANNNIFAFEQSSTSLTLNIENTKSLNFSLVDFENKLNSDLVLIPFKLPLIEEVFLDVSLKSFSVINDNHTLIIETNNETGTGIINKKLILQ